MVTRPKKQFDTLDKAIAVAKLENAKPEHIHKVVAYKCRICFKYHVGRNGKEITDKQRAKLQKEQTAKTTFNERKFKGAVSNLKVVGYVDLSKIKY